MMSRQAPDEAVHAVQVDAFGPVVVFASEAVRDVVRCMRSAEPSAIRNMLTKANGSPQLPADPLVAEEDSSALQADAASAVRKQVLRLVDQMLPDAEVEMEQV
jgi:hypothetical protein